MRVCVSTSSSESGSKSSSKSSSKSIIVRTCGLTKSTSKLMMAMTENTVLIVAGQFSEN